MNKNYHPGHSCSDFTVHPPKLMCQCKWIDAVGHPTPDQNEAIGMAVCYDPLSFGEKGSDPFPICEEHAKRKSKYWKLLPLPGQGDEKNWNAIVYVDHKSFKIIPDIVSQSIRESFPDNAESILKQLNWSELNGCFYFLLRGIYYGVEESDGHIRT